MQAPVEEVEGILAPAKWGFWVGFFPGKDEGAKEDRERIHLGFLAKKGQKHFRLI